MKKALYILILIIGTGVLGAQNETSCYDQWAKAFEVRGADEVKDGWHEKVVISIRSGSRTKCFTAKVQVSDHLIHDIYIKFVDGKFELYKPNWKYPDQKAAIINGISKTLQTTDDDLVNIIFINHLKPKKQAFELAPLPDIDDF